MWQKQQDIEGNRFHVELDSLPLLPHPDPVAVQQACDNLLAVAYPKEPPMYRPFAAFLADYLSETDFLVIDTHNQFYLGGFAPDITVSLPGVAVADAMSMVLFVEIKPQDKTTLGSDHNLGQVYEYLLAAARCQRERTKFVGILSDFHANIAVVLTRIDKYVYLTHYVAALLPQILQFITYILGDDDFKPPKLGFSEPIGPMLQRLGYPSNSIVGEFALREWFPLEAGVVPQTIPAGLTDASLKQRPRMAVKRSKYPNSGALDQEVSVLLTIRQFNGHNSLPYIVHLSEDHSEIGILPIGLPITSNTLSVSGLGIKIVEGVLSGLGFLHELGFIHRDVRQANVVLHGSTAVLIDFDAAAPAGQLTSHMGGCICMPEEVLLNPGEPYIPRPEHDFLAVVLMVNSLLFPGAYRGFRSMNMCIEDSVERGRVIELWARLRASLVWGPLVRYAENCMVEELREGLQALLVSL